MVTPFVPADRLARFRALDESAMPGTCDFSRTAPGTRNPDNSREPGATTVTPGVPCRFTDRALGTNLILIALRVEPNIQALLAVPLGTDAVAGDRVLFNGVTYEIVATDAGAAFATSLALALRIVTT